MSKYYTISQIAKIVNMTTEALRHYDRINLLKPSYINSETNYRYYNDDQIVYLNTIQALRCMDISLKKIKEILGYKELHKIIALLNDAESFAEQKILRINQAKQKIAKARKFYETKINDFVQQEGIFIKTLPERVILLSDNLIKPNLDNLWNYHRHFYKQLEKSISKKFEFADLAGVYISKEKSTMFALCNNFQRVENLKILPAGKYLCLNCTEKQKPKSLLRLKKEASTKYQTNIDFIIEIIVLTGILNWNYELQIYIDNN